MKRLLSLLSCVMMVLALSVTALPREAAAEFAERPVGFVVIDQDGDVDGAIYKSWRQVVKWAYHFPYYQIVDAAAPQQLVADAVREGAKLEKESLAALAEKSGVDVLVVARVYELDEYMVQGMGIFEDHETYVRTSACVDLFVYKKDGDKFLKKKLRERRLRELGNVEHPEETIKWELSKLVNTMENRPIIGS
ncbi:MAG: hypothetical protein SO119_05570 [Phascolarctobacterium sp.]|nr:hypothetical protein [Phascolarctobacterium sp.]